MCYPGHHQSHVPSRPRLLHRQLRQQPRQLIGIPPHRLRCAFRHPPRNVRSPLSLLSRITKDRRHQGPHRRSRPLYLPGHLPGPHQPPPAIPKLTNPGQRRPRHGAQHTSTATQRARKYTAPMFLLLDHPAAFFPAALALLLLAGAAGLAIRTRRPELVGPDHQADLTALQAAVLGLLGLLLGFSFAMAVNRYDLRKQLEVDEANAIGTTWLRTSTLEEPARTSARNLLRAYVPLRIGLPNVGTDPTSISAANRMADLQAQLWEVASTAANSRPDPVRALFLSTVNESIDLSEKRTAALENRIPNLAWIMLLFMAAAASFLTGTSLTSRSPLLLCVLPVVVGAALTLILDLDTAHTGYLQLQQQSLHRLQQQIDATPR